MGIKFEKFHAAMAPGGFSKYQAQLIFDSMDESEKEIVTEGDMSREKVTLAVSTWKQRTKAEVDGIKVEVVDDDTVLDDVSADPSGSQQKSDAT